MPWPAAGNDEQGIDPDIVAVAHEAWREPLGSDRDSPKAPIVERVSRGVLVSTCLDLDKGEGASPPGNDIDFTTGHPGSPGQDPPTAQPQVPTSEGLRAPAALLGPLPVHLLRSSARA